VEVQEVQDFEVGDVFWNGKSVVAIFEMGGPESNEKKYIFGGFLNKIFQIHPMEPLSYSDVKKLLHSGKYSRVIV